MKRKGDPKTGGRQVGTPNKATALLKDAILQAATLAGGKDGLVGYLQARAIDTPGPFLSLVGKVLPMQVDAGVDGKIIVQIIQMADADNTAPS
jgi:hypothetical protein